MGIVVGFGCTHGVCCGVVAGMLILAPLEVVQLVVQMEVDQLVASLEASDPLSISWAFYFLVEKTWLDARTELQ